jgi:vitamin B12 transporter
MQQSSLRRFHRRALVLFTLASIAVPLCAAPPASSSTAPSTSDAPPVAPVLPRGVTGAQSSPSEVTPVKPPAAPSGTKSVATKPATKSSSKTAATSKTSAETTAASENGVRELAPIYVTAPTRDTQPLDTTATTTTVLDHDDLQNNKYALVPDALQSVPGLAVVTSGMPGAQTSVFVHGLEARQTLVTVDGRRQSSGFSGADDNLTNLTLDNVDQIEVVKTPVTTAQGGGAMGGVINLVSLSGKGVAPTGDAWFEGGSFDTFREGAESRGQIGNFDFAVAGSRQDSIYPSDSSGYAPFFTSGDPNQADQYRNSSFRGNMGYQVSEDIYVDFHAAYSNAYTNSPNQWTTPDPTASLDIEDWNLSPEVVWKVNDFYTTKLYYIRDQQRVASNDPFEAQQLISFGLSPQGFQDREQLNTDSVDWQNDFQLARNWSITAGVQGDNRDFYVDDNNLGGRILSGNQNNLGGYISSQWQPIDGLNVLTSGRYDSYSASKGAFSWRQGVTYLVAPTQTQLHASVADAYTPPSIQDLFLSSALGPIIANPNLVPETDLGWEAGVTQPFWDNRITASATYFHNDVHHDIEDVSTPLPGEPFAETTENVNHVVTEGVETSLTVQPFTNLTLNGSYTYLTAVNEDTHIFLLRRPRHTFNFTGTWNPIKPLTLTLGGLYIIGRDDIDAITGLQEGAPDYFILRASATYQIDKSWSVWVRGENLTDRNYQPALGFYGPSMACYGGVKFSF